jgi:pyrroline-5-carboxylate reductase
LLAVKPQAFGDLARVIAPATRAKVVISIMAGLSSSALQHALGGQVRMIRVMPNMPCQIGAGMTAICLGQGARSGDEELAVKIFDALGRTAMVDEAIMNSVTAVSGSGPAYVFHLAEAMEKAAIALGFDPSAARIFVAQTILGAGRMLNESSQSAADLRAAVTSPGGTTAAALSVFERNGFVEMVIDALTAARDRGAQLDRVQ